MESSKQYPKKLPNDILLAIIKCSIPSDSVTIYAPYHTVTKTLLSWSRVCRSTHTMATRLLRRHCLYIDSHERLLALVNSIKAHGGNFPTSRPPERIYLSLFPKAKSSINLQHYRYHNALLNERRRNRAHLDAKSGIISYIVRRNDGIRSSGLSVHVGEAKISTAVRDLLLAVLTALRRLIVIIRLEDFALEQHVGSLLRDGFSSLCLLEEFISIRDKLYHAMPGGVSDNKISSWETWWPKLRLLRLYHPSAWESIDVNDQ